MKNKKENQFTKTTLSIAVAAILATANVSAQETADEESEVIVVTGVRSSLAESLANKKDANSLVDSIAAEELGRFPDDNVADSLSHIPGITVSRTRGGEAQYVNIRGLGPEFTIVTLNNRILATDDGGRNFAFDVIPSEMISGADVWKTVQGKNLEGSIGGAVNLKSARPFTNPGMHGAVSITGDYNDFSEEIGKKFNGVFSNTNDDETFGFIVGFSSSSGTERSDDMFDNYIFGVNDGIEYDVNEDGVITENEQNLVMPGSYGIGAYETDFKRNGITSTLQWRPTDRLSLTADILITKLEADKTGFAQSFYMVDESEAQDRLSNITLDGNVVTGMDIADVTMEVVTLDEHRTVDTSMYALNAEYLLTDELTIKADVYRSNSSRDSGGKNTFVVAGSPGAHSGRYQLNEGGLPDYIPNWTEGRTSDDFGNDDFSPHWAARDGSDIEDTVTGYTMDAEWELDGEYLTSVDFGAAYTSRNKTNTAYNNYETGACNYCGYPFTFGEVGADVVRDFPFDNFFEGDSADIPRSFPIFSIPDYAAGLAASDGQTITDYAGNTRTFGENESALWEPVINPVNSYDIEENTTAAYFQANFEGEGWFGNVGVRYISTDVSAGYSYNEILSIQIVDPNAANPSWDVEYSDSAAQLAKGDYSKLLPAANFGIYLQEDLLLRLGAGQSLSRPTLDQMAPLTTDNAQSGLFTMDISGNANIEPVFADQFDIAIEWYFAENSLLSASAFRKDLDGFITSNTTNVTIAGESFTVTQPINGDSAEVEGIEIAIQKFFENGFGVTASYAYTDSSTIVNGEKAGPLTGVADTSYSLSLIYEKDKISTQIALDYTGDYVVDPYSPLGDDYQTTGEAVSMVTASFNYNLSDNAQLFLEGNNLLNEQNRTFQGRSDLPGSIQIYGRTIKFGARYTF
ncbi:TonB-dependent receptor [Colwellia sp. 4_MG-2023]|jgi:TonB-dependent receptor|uniref:TonB-dependent receptor n=1 Tax=unclassified Colwellia TaxID=196834 RepID=UPI001C09B3D2|nr:MULTISPECIES: TonB-dependent receptor [unclassified Colwellia]MBU2926293.1 TonB-dependent receptor [Colwellia sp. C2M11]MDO6488916.1 TonB-dependent receptor [Colwellia sp. 6_MG-2023]MDO6506601.1 TonB-dependent receptor [Colwellia sp. 5_MG-2023]MDO6555088.1 TonB-dependent receptor [Colwellia sp. 4_MG-2023]MDO6651731.1 TonB-dependent receptor [Colwellia sp. 3_MG-2023]